MDDALNSRSATLAEWQQLLIQVTAQKETLRAETTERIASALQEHNSDVAHQVSVLESEFVSGCCLLWLYTAECSCSHCPTVHATVYLPRSHTGCLTRQQDIGPTNLVGCLS